MKKLKFLIILLATLHLPAHAMQHTSTTAATAAQPMAQGTAAPSADEIESAAKRLSELITEEEQMFVLPSACSDNSIERNKKELDEFLGRYSISIHEDIRQRAEEILMGLTRKRPPLQEKTTKVTMFQPLLNECVQLHEKVLRLKGVRCRYKLQLLMELEADYKRIEISEKPEDYTRFDQILKCHKVLLADLDILRVVLNVFCLKKVSRKFLALIYMPKFSTSFFLKELIPQFFQCTDAQLDDIENELKKIPHLADTNLRLPPSTNNVLLHALYEARHLPLEEEQTSRIANIERFFNNVHRNKCSRTSPLNLFEFTFKQVEGSLSRFVQEFNAIRRLNLIEPDPSTMWGRMILKKQLSSISPSDNESALHKFIQERQNILKDRFPDVILPPLQNLIAQYDMSLVEPLALTQ